jgi:pimeloyl-ACP methyl ester carboxylesterase
MQTLSAPTASHWDWRGHRIYFVHAPSQGSDPTGQQRPPLLLIHGFGASTDHWRKTIEGLSKEFDVWAIDLLGFGRSSKPDIAYSTDLWREQLNDFISTQMGRPTVLVGNSLGGYSALCVAAQHPESVAGLVLLNSAGAFSEVGTTQAANPVQQTIATVMRSLLLQPLPSWLLFQYARQRSVIRKTLQKVYLDQTAVTDRLVEEIYQPSCDPGAANVFAAVFKSPKGQTVDALLHQMQCPLLLLWGEGDPWMNTRSRGEKFRQHYTQLTEHYLQAGHCPHDELPDQVNALMRSWMMEHVMSI